MSLACHAHGQTDVGRLRQANEDRFSIEVLPGGSTLLVVCDGLGGHEGGQVASEVAITSIAESMRTRLTLPPPQALFESLTAAHEAVRREALARSLVGMGTTAVAAWVDGTKAWVGWVGDSRLYHLRDGRVVERTLDHTKVQRLILEGSIAPADAAIHPEAHVLEKALGGSGNLAPEVWNEALDLHSGDVLLLCTDGLHDMLTEGMLYRLIEGQDPEGGARALVEKANSNGGHDNVTAVIALLGGKRIPLMPELEDTESGNRSSSSGERGASSGGKGISAIFSRREPSTGWGSRSVLRVPSAAEVPAWATALVAIGMLAAGLALGVRWARSHPAPAAQVATP